MITEIQTPHLLRDTRFRIPLSKVGFPIRKSADQSFFAAPRGLSQRSTSFIASQRQGIHQMPLSHLINSHYQCPSIVRSLRQFSANSRNKICNGRYRPNTNLHSRRSDTDLERPLFLLHKIEPTARRSSFADMSMRDIGRWIVAAVEHVIRSAQNVLASGRNVRPERSSLHDVRQHAHDERPVDGTFR